MKKDNSDDVSDEVCISLLRKLEKQRKESIEAFEKAISLDPGDQAAHKQLS